MGVKPVMKSQQRETENDDYDVIIIGAGASGLSAASYLIQRDQKVLVLEALERPGSYRSRNIFLSIC
jgi:cation diffusion facilitator CzcD-associated flavoprotein CzcO